MQAAFIVMVMGAADVANGQDVFGALLGRAEIPPDQFELADLNSDNIIDSGDALLLTWADGVPIASFVAADSTAREGDGTATVAVSFSRPYTGTLRWSVGGSASLGVDYAGGSNQLALSGQVTAHIPVMLLDDGIIEPDVKVVRLDLSGDSSYQLGGLQSHALYLLDNDTVWEGSLTAGYTALDFRLETIFQNGNTTGRLVSDGNGAFPEGDFPLTSLNIGGSTFNAIASEIGMPSGSFFAQRPIARRLVLNASASNSSHILMPDFIQGTATDSIMADEEADAYLNRDVTGIFVLARRQQPLPPQTPPLLPLPSRLAGGVR